MSDVIFEIEVALKNVMNKTAEKGDIGSSPDWQPNVRQCAGSGESRIYMDDLGAAFLCCHYPTKPDGMGFRHGGAFDQYTIGVRQILLRGGGSATAKRGAQTGHRARVSYSRLIGNRDHAESGGKQFFD